MLPTTDAETSGTAESRTSEMRPWTTVLAQVAEHRTSPAPGIVMKIRRLEVARELSLDSEQLVDILSTRLLRMPRWIRHRELFVVADRGIRHGCWWQDQE